MTITIDGTLAEMRDLFGMNGQAATLTQITMKLDALNGTVSDLSGDVNVLAGGVQTQTGEENKVSQALDSKLDELGAKEDAVIALLNTDTTEIAALQAAVSAQTDDTAAQAKAQALIDKLTAVLPAPAPPDPTPAPTAPDSGGSGDTTISGGTTDTSATPVPVTGTDTTGSAGGPAA